MNSSIPCSCIRNIHPHFIPPPPLSVDKLKSEQIKNFWTIIHISSCVWVKLIWDQTICMCRKKGKIPDKKYCYICIYSRVVFFILWNNPKNMLHKHMYQLLHWSSHSMSLWDDNHLTQGHCEILIISLKVTAR